MFELGVWKSPIPDIFRPDRVGSASIYKRRMAYAVETDVNALIDLFDQKVRAFTISLRGVCDVYALYTGKARSNLQLSDLQSGLETNGIFIHTSGTIMSHELAIMPISCRRYLVYSKS